MNQTYSKVDEALSFVMSTLGEAINVKASPDMTIGECASLYLMLHRHCVSISKTREHVARVGKLEY